MPRLAVVFDSNAYRSLSDDRAIILRRAERSAGVLPVANQWVCAELLSHLASPTDGAFRSAWAALRRLAPHCSFFDGSRNIIRFHVGADAQLLKSLFGRTPAERHSVDAYGALIGAIAEAPSSDHFTNYAHILERTAQFVQSIEDIWSGSVQSEIPRAFANLSARWAPHLSDSQRRRRTAELLRSDKALHPCARMYVNNVSRFHDLHATEDDLERAAAQCLQMFPIPVRLYNAILAKVIENPDFNLSKRANWIWDVQLAFTVSPALSADGSPIWLVTSDDDILEAAAEAGASQFVCSLVRYEAILHEGTDSLLEALAGRGPA